MDFINAINFTTNLLDRWNFMLEHVKSIQEIIKTAHTNMRERRQNTDVSPQELIAHNEFVIQKIQEVDTILHQIREEMGQNFVVNPKTPN